MQTVIETPAGNSNLIRKIDHVFSRAYGLWHVLSKEVFVFALLQHRSPYNIVYNFTAFHYSPSNITANEYLQQVKYV